MKSLNLSSRIDSSQALYWIFYIFLGNIVGKFALIENNKKYWTLLEKEGIADVRISYGTSVKEIKEVSRSYKEAKMALDVGKIFFNERDVIAYSELGIGRLIYQLPIPLCKMFIKEIFGGKSPDDFDEETLTTINKAHTIAHKQLLLFVFITEKQR